MGLSWPTYWTGKGRETSTARGLLNARLAANHHLLECSWYPWKKGLLALHKEQSPEKLRQPPQATQLVTAEQGFEPGIIRFGPTHLLCRGEGKGRKSHWKGRASSPGPGPAFITSIWAGLYLRDGKAGAPRTGAPVPWGFEARQHSHQPRMCHQDVSAPVPCSGGRGSPGSALCQGHLQNFMTWQPFVPRLSLSFQHLQPRGRWHFCPGLTLRDSRHPSSRSAPTKAAPRALGRFLGQTHSGLAGRACGLGLAASTPATNGRSPGRWLAHIPEPQAGACLARRALTYRQAEAERNAFPLRWHPGDSRVPSSLQWTVLPLCYRTVATRGPPPLPVSGGAA